jgi:hypothetical protein
MQQSYGPFTLRRYGPPVDVGGQCFRRACLYYKEIVTRVDGNWMKSEPQPPLVTCRLVSTGRKKRRWLLMVGSSENAHFTGRRAQVCMEEQSFGTKQKAMYYLLEMQAWKVRRSSRDGRA